MRARTEKRTRSLIITITVLSLSFIVGLMHIEQQTSASPKKGALLVQAEAAQGRAEPGNAQPANFLVVVTDPNTGEAVTDLVQGDFQIINHFAVTGQTCGFSNNIVSFVNVGTGAYQIRVGLTVPGCTWVEGDYLAQVIVSDGARQGQATASLSVE
jgi:hypothetical protein